MSVVGLILINLLIILVPPESLCSARRKVGRHRTVRHIQDGSIRLVGGQSKHEGNVEIYHVGQWGTVCDDEWDMREALVVCRSLGYFNVSRPTENSKFGKGRRVIWMDNLYCDGSENSLDECKFDGWGIHDCTVTESAGVICKNDKEFDSKPTRASVAKRRKLRERHIQSKDIPLRLMGGRNHQEGRVEVQIDEKKWGVICADGWSLLEATVICKQLALGYGQAAVQSSYFGGRQEDIVLSGVKCTGRENNISDCTYDTLDHTFCPGKDESIAGVICANELPDLVPDEIEVERSAYLEDRQLLFLQCAMEENCLASAVYALDRNDYGWHYEQRRLLRFSARIGNIGSADFRPFLPKHAWQWHMCHLHYHSMEVFAHFDITNMEGVKVAEGHKASFCLEDTNCVPGVEKKFACANYGDQGISVGCTDTYLHNIDCQWVDITDLQPGMYIFKVSINPEFKVAELNYENNAVVCSLYYNAVSARLLNCTLTRP